MKAFTYERPASGADAAKAVAGQANARFIAGGTNLLDLMKLQVETPATLIDVNRLPLDKVEATQDGGLRGEILLQCHLRVLLHGHQLLAEPERGEQLSLGGQPGEGEAGRCPGSLQRREVDVRREILPPHPAVGIVGDGVTGVPTHQPGTASGRVQFLGGIPVIDDQRVPPLQAGRHPAERHRLRLRIRDDRPDGQGRAVPQPRRHRARHPDDDHTARLGVRPDDVATEAGSPGAGTRPPALGGCPGRGRLGAHGGGGARASSCSLSLLGCRACAPSTATSTAAKPTSE